MRDPINEIAALIHDHLKRAKAIEFILKSVENLITRSDYAKALKVTKDKLRDCA